MMLALWVSAGWRTSLRAVLKNFLPRHLSTLKIHYLFPNYTQICYKL